MNKCEWKGNMLTACYEMRKEYSRSGVCYSKRWDYCPFCGADIRKPIEIKVGQFGHFWDDSESERGAWGVLHIPSDGSEYPYCKARVWYQHFTPGLPAGFNKNGEPIDE